MEAGRRDRGKLGRISDWLVARASSPGFRGNEAYPTTDAAPLWVRIGEALLGLGGLRWETFQSAQLHLHGDRRRNPRRKLLGQLFVGQLSYPLGRKLIMEDNKMLVLVVGLLGVSAIAAFVAIMIFYSGDKTVALAGLTALIGLLIPNMLTLRQGAMAARLADVAAVNAAEASSKATELKAQVGSVHNIVNGERTALMARVSSLEILLAQERQSREIREAVDKSNRGG